MGWGWWCPSGVCLNSLNPNDNRGPGFEVLFSFSTSWWGQQLSLQGPIPENSHASDSVSLLCPGPCGSGIPGDCQPELEDACEACAIGSLTRVGGGVGFVISFLTDDTSLLVDTSHGVASLSIPSERSWEDQVSLAPPWPRLVLCGWYKEGWPSLKAVHSSSIPSIPLCEDG